MEPTATKQFDMQALPVFRCDYSVEPDGTLKLTIKTTTRFQTAGSEKVENPAPADADNAGETSF